MNLINARILCLGNRLFAPDSAGPMVYDLLAENPLPACTDLVDGGLGGLNLLCCLEQTELVVFVDTVAGFRQTPGVVVINPREAILPDSRYDHDAGLAYLLQAAPHVLENDLPEMILIGIEGRPTPELCRQAADTCLAIITAGQNRGRFPARALEGGGND